MVTAVATKSAPANGSQSRFLPLTVDYRQKAAAAGRIPTNHLRREMGASDQEILTSRLIDRSIRPLFPKGFLSETQVSCNLLAVDGQNDPDILSINAASAALAMSDIPWNGPVGAVRVGLVDSEIIVNPTRKQRERSTLNLVVTGADKSKVVMLEASAENILQTTFIKAINQGIKETSKIVKKIKEFCGKCGKKKRPIWPYELHDDVKEQISSLSLPQIREVFMDYSHHKISRDNAISRICKNVTSIVSKDFLNEDITMLREYFYNLSGQVLRDLIFENNIRCDGRKLTELRPITCEVDLYEPLHGSAMFQRGQTQVLCTVTFDSPDSAAKVDTMSALMGGVKEKNFFLHYEFPPYATNETGKVGIAGRRELGHGALAEKALRPVVPSDFPFTIRLTAEVLESNGSSSMASACAGSLALMDAGVPLQHPVAGVAVGLVTRSEGDSAEISDHRLLTDILGIEDYCGDMDFKLAGTSNGITALQADVKLPGLPLAIVIDSVNVGATGLRQVLKKMNYCLQTPRPTRKHNGPVMDKLDVPASKRARFVGPSGINLRRLLADTGVSVTTLDECTFQVFAPNQTAMDEASEKIQQLLKEEKEPELEFGAIYTAKIVEIKEFGVMVQLHPSLQPSLVHNSQLDQKKVSHPSALDLREGQEISVKYFGRDPANGRVRLSRKAIYSTANSIIRNLMPPTS